MVLITNRTIEDVKRWQTLRDKGWAKMTDAERSEWLGETSNTPSANRGMYTHEDMNRVENAVNTLRSRFEEFGYKLPTMTLKTDWVRNDVVTREEMSRYLSNIETLRSVLAVFPKTPRTPNINSPWDYTKANDIETILNDIQTVINNMTKSWYYTGEIVSGEV